MDIVNTKMSSLTKEAFNVLESLDDKENERIKMEKKLNHVNISFFSHKKEHAMTQSKYL